jgi:hypothetical protein
MWKAHHLAMLSCVEKPELIERRDKLESASRVPLLTIGLASEAALHGLRQFTALTAFKTGLSVAVTERCRSRLSLSGQAEH